MSYTPSTSPDWTESVPFPVSSRTTAVAYGGGGTGSTVGGAHLGFNDPKFDLAVGDLPFMLAISEQLPYTRETNPFQKQQIDTSRESGEHTLSAWWVRDETSWHRGAGISFYEPGTDQGTRYRYLESVGIDVWTQGEAKLHKSMSLLHAGGSGLASFVASAVISGVDTLFELANGAMYKTTTSGSTTITVTGGTPSTKMALAGNLLLVGSTSGILSGDISGSSVAALWTTTSGYQFVPYWAKSRIIASSNNDLYELTTAGGNLDTTSPLYSHPVASWNWTAVADAPAAILAAGYNNGQGAIYALRLVEGTTSGSTPTIGAAAQVAEMPPGEEVHSLQTYLGKYVAIGTNRGIRIGVMASDGTMEYGPLTVQTTNEVRDLANRDRFVYGSVTSEIDGGSGVVRIDLSEEIPTEQGGTSANSYGGTGRYAWSWDVQVHTTDTAWSVAFLGASDRVAVGTATGGCYLQSATDYESTGYLTTGKIRYATAEEKIFQFMQLRTDIPGDSTVSIWTIDTDGNLVFNNTLGAGSVTTQDITINALSQLQKQMSFKLVLNSTSAGTDTPVIDNFQVKAQPNPAIQRMIRYPINLHDREEDVYGVKFGYEGFAWERLSALEALESAGSVALIQDLTNGEAFLGKIVSIQFRRISPRARNDPGFGGVGEITVLKL